MANNQPKVRKLSGESPDKSGGGTEPAQGFAGGHPIFGTAPVASVTITRLRYRNGDGRTTPIRTPLAPIPPERLIDLGIIGQLYGPGRYDVRGVDERGALAWRPECIDCPDEEGNLHLIAPSPQAETTAGATVATAAAAPQIQKDMLDIYKDIAAQAEKSRANDFQAFVKLMEAQRAAPSSGGELVSFLHAELGASRARCADLERRLEDSREDGQKSRDSLLRKTLASDGKDDLFTRALQVAVERFGVALPTTAGAATAQSTAPDEIRLPSAEELAGMLHQGVVPQSVILQAVKLHRAGGLRPDLWALVEPVATMAGLL